MKPKLIIDTDPGADDAIALILALRQKKFDIEGVISVYGNHTAQQTAINIGGLLSSHTINPNHKLPTIGMGSNKPLVRSFTPFLNIHGKTGIGSFVAKSEGIYLSKLPPEEFYLDLVSKNKHKISVLCLGPLTNLAKFIIKYPKYAICIKEIYIMGGALFFPGNYNYNLEANFAMDPDAANIVLNSKIKNIFLMPLDITTPFQLNSLNKIKNMPLKVEISKILEDYNKYYLKEKIFYLDQSLNKKQYLSGSLHDVLAMMMLVKKSNYSTKKIKVKIDTTQINPGQILLQSKKDKSFDKLRSIDIVTKVKYSNVWRDFFSLINL